MASFRSQDMRAEKQLGMFMDDYFYSRLSTKDGTPIFFQRKSDLKSQLQGVDVCIETSNRRMLIDEKASLYYSNAMIPTFAFEIDSLQKGHDNPVEGWFINDELLTEYYMLIWPNIKCTRSNEDRQWKRKDLDHLTKDDFTIIEAMLIEKQSIRSMLEKKGYNRSRLLEYARLIRKMADESDAIIEKNIAENVKITYSGQIAEKPVNLVIRKEVLKQMSKGIYLISQDGYANIRSEVWNLSK